MFRGRSSSGRAPPCQGGGSEFEPRRPLQKRGHNVSCDLFFGFRQEIKMLGRSEFALRQGFAAQNTCTAQKRRFFGSSGQRGEQGASEARKRPSGAFGARCACRGTAVLRASLVARSKKRGHNVSCDLFFGFRQEIKMLGRSEFALRQGFAAQNACTAQKRRFFGFQQEIKMLGRSEFVLRQGFAAQNACTAQKRCFCFGRPNRYGTSELGVLFFIRTFPVND